MALATFINGVTSPKQGYPGHMELGGFSAYCFMGRAQFPGGATSCTLPNRGGGNNAIRCVFISKGNANITAESYAANSDGTVTVSRTDTTSNAEFSFLVIYG